MKSAAITAALFTYYLLMLLYMCFDHEAQQQVNIFLTTVCGTTSSLKPLVFSLPIMAALAFLSDSGESQLSTNVHCRV